MGDLRQWRTGLNGISPVFCETPHAKTRDASDSAVIAIDCRLVCLASKPIGIDSCRTRASIFTSRQAGYFNVCPGRQRIGRGIAMGLPLRSLAVLAAGTVCLSSCLFARSVGRLPAHFVSLRVAESVPAETAAPP